MATISSSFTGMGMPSQLKTYNQKVANGNEHGKLTIDAICNMSTLTSSYNNWKIRKLYDAVHGIIHDEDYEEITRPYGEERQELPTELRNYPLLNSDLAVLGGEKNDMGTSFQVITSNPDVTTEKEEMLMEALIKEQDQEFANELNRRGEDPGRPTDETRNPKEIVQEKESSFKSERAIQGQEALNYIYNECELHDKFVDNFNNYLISAYEFSHKYIVDSQIYYKNLFPTNVDYSKDVDVEFVEDAHWALYRVLEHASTIIDEFYNELTEEEIQQLENPNQTTTYQFPAAGGQSGSSPAYSGGWTDVDADYNNEINNRGMEGTNPNIQKDRLVEKVYVCWKSKRKIGILKYKDELGAENETVVDEDYKPQKELGETVEWLWVNQVWEGYKIDGKLYKKIRPVPNQRNSLNNLSECKLPINGRAHTTANSRNISFVGLGKPYQVTYNIYKYKLNNAIAKAKDVLAMLDINLVPDNYSMDQWMYLIEKSGIAWVNYQQIAGDELPATHQNILDLSLKTIDQYINLLNQIVAEWERVSGITAQRRASIGQYQGKSTTEQAIIQSSYMTDEYFRKHQRFEQRELQGLLDLSKIAWREGKKGSYLSTRERLKVISIDGAEHQESDYSVFVVNSRKEQRNKQKAEEMIQPMLQNEGKVSDALEIIQSESFEKIKEKIKDTEDTQKKMEEAIQKARNEGFKEGKQRAEDFKKQELELEKFKAKQDAQAQQRENEIDNKEVEYDKEIEERKIQQDSQQNDS